MKKYRVRALVGKELREVSRNLAVLLPVGIVTMVALVLPFVVAMGIPAITGHPLGDDRDLVNVSGAIPGPGYLAGEARVQYFLFQQFLLVFLLMPITGAMALAAHAVVGEKQARTLEPLLATPVTTAELLVAKVLGALAPTLGIALPGLVLYFAGIAALAEPGVLRAMLVPRTLLMIGLLGPAAALVSLQAAIVVSSRVNDARTAQQFGVLLILPLTVVLIAQFTGSLWLTTAQLALIGLGLLALWAALTLVSVVLFERETILTRWR
ncbi:MAG: ABC transporter permease subunit [Acidobacteria bacterium]|nr:ABC transporter permease subunit [Acidobacteriota bacterium]